MTPVRAAAGKSIKIAMGNKKMKIERELDGVLYRVLVKADQIRNYVELITKEEWSLGDFEQYGDDLCQAKWKLEEVMIEKIQSNNILLATAKFQKDLQPRILKQREIQRQKIAIPPLILRGSNLLIFDGYARWSVFKEKGVKKCLAYVGHLSKKRKRKYKECRGK
jgi:hypothetical protein